MTRKQERVPGMRDAKPNREQRRHPEGRRLEDEPLSRDGALPEQQDVPDPRTKTSGHRKKTAERWNQ